MAGPLRRQSEAAASLDHRRGEGKAAGTGGRPREGAGGGAGREWARGTAPVACQSLGPERPTYVCPGGAPVSQTRPTWLARGGGCARKASGPERAVH
eukprot:8108538-Heterocapsa_arctica.AAC.1